MIALFTLDEMRLREYLDTLDPEDDLPVVWATSPARCLDEIVAQFGRYIDNRSGAEILVYPLVYESDPDGVLVVVRKTFSQPGLAGTPADWDDYFSANQLDETLTPSQVVEVLAAVVAEANRLIEAS